MGKLYVGTSGWSYPQWKPEFYPAKLPSSKFLNYYATRLNAVEVNYTFRRLPTAKLLGGWVQNTPAEFRFAVKAHQMITHIKRLRDTGEWVRRLVDSLGLLLDEGRLGPVLFQLPPNLKFDAESLSTFLEELPPGLRSAFEFRHESWFCEEVYSLLRRRNAALCEAESEKIETPPVETADFAYLRLRKPDYSAAAKKVISSKIGEMRKRGDVFAFFKHEDSPEGALNAEHLRRNS